MATNDPTTRAIQLGRDSLTVPDGRPIDRQLEQIHKDYVRRRFANEATVRGTQDAVEKIVDLNTFAVGEFARGAEGIARVVQQAGRSSFAQEPIEAYGRRRIEAMAKHTEATVDHAAYQMADAATRPYRTSPPPSRKLSVGERILGRTEGS